MPVSRSAWLLATVTALLAAAPSAARAQDCTPPGKEPRASERICNFAPEVAVSPYDVEVGQPAVPVAIRAMDHYSDNEFSSLKILLDGQNVTSAWPMDTSVVNENNTGRALVFTSTGIVRLSLEKQIRTLAAELCDAAQIETQPGVFEQQCDRKTRTYRLRLPGVEVGEDGTTSTQAPAATRTTPFTVRNTGNAPATFHLFAECRLAMDGQRVEPCSVESSSGPLAPGATKTVNATYPASQAGSTVNVLVRAQHAGAPGVQDAGWTDIAILAANGQQAPARVTLVPLNAGTNVERGLCVTVATAARGAYECGDLRIAHGLPVHRTRGRAWAPALLYNSQHAHPRPIVYADVTVPAGPTVAVEVLVRTEDGVVHRAAYAGGDFLPGVPRRVGVQWDALQTPTGLYKYWVQVITHYPGGSRETNEYPGEIAIVNRASSPFGAGWWLAGLESIQCVGCATGSSRMLWVGGDGSTRVFEPTPTRPGWTEWTARNPDGPPDTLRLAGGVYTRKLRGGGEVRYDGAGRHTHTVNRLQQATQFTYGTHGISGIHAPGAGAGGPGTGDPAWTMNWDGAAGLVRSITAKVQGAADRTTSLTIDGGRRVSGIVDPDGEAVAFGYDVQVTRRIDQQRNRRGSWTLYEYGAGGKLRSARLQMGTSANPAVDPTTRFTAVEGLGVAFEGAMSAPSAASVQAYTRIDGPRTDVSDVTLLWANAAGVVRRVRDPLGGETFVQHDARWPALATQVTGPTGRVTQAQYDTLGRVESSRVVNVLGDGRDHLTMYAYDSLWHAPTAVASYEVAPGTPWKPLGGTARAGYDPVNGNVLWKQQGDDQARRVVFNYYGPAAGAAAGQLASVRAPSGVPGKTARDSLIYDARGNLRMTVSPLNYLSLVDRDPLGREKLSITPVTVAGAGDEAALRATGVQRHTTWDVMDRVRYTTTIGPAMQQAAGTPSVILPNYTAGDTLLVETTYDEEGLPLEVKRSVSPDPAQLHSLSNVYTYDGAGRKITEFDQVALHTFEYDLGGNLIKSITPRGDTIRSQYDVMGRMVRRVVPEASYPMTCPVKAPCDDPFPAHPNGPAGSLVIPEEWTTYRFDADGNMVYAENADAIVNRSYYRNGALRTDSIAIRGVQGVDFTTHRYGLLYGYNVAGQVTSMQHPTNLATDPDQQWDQFSYDPVTGALASLRDRRNHYFEFRRNAAGQMTSLGGPQYSDSMRYDLEGRLVKRMEWSGNPAAPLLLHNDSIGYDARGKQTYVKVGDAGGRQPSEYWQWYSGIGNLVGTDWQNEADRGRMQEAYGTDALGNVVWRRSDDGGGGSAHIRWEQEYDAGLGRLRTIGSVNTGYASADFYPENTTRSYDAAGNVRRAVLSQMGDVNGNVDEVRNKISLSFYGADQRLRYFQERDLRRVQESSWTVQREGVWEEYRYDPLGRRVMVNTRTAGLCNSGGFRCASATTHMVWAGDQLLWEIRRASESMGEEPSTAGSYGTVSYTHAGGIDRPLVITKDGTSILPHQNWRGQFSSGTRPDDGSRSDCGPGVVTNCVQIAWPGHRTTAWHHAAKEPEIRTWWGGLVDGMRDASGQMYMRNRYYDPATGQFTQPDPIGIAGGLNSYGFAAGDPVSYSDPYGLSPSDTTFSGADGGEVARRLWHQLRSDAQTAAASSDVRMSANGHLVLSIMNDAENSSTMFNINVGPQDNNWRSVFQGGGAEGGFDCPEVSCDITLDPTVNTGVRLEVKLTHEITGALMRTRVANPKSDGIHLSPFGSIGGENGARAIYGCTRVESHSGAVPACP